jgi:hypothetical protein
MDIETYLNQVWEEGRLDDEILRIQNLLLGLTKYPHPDKAIQARKVQLMTQIFKGLLSTKEAREKRIQQIRQDNSCSPQYGSTRPAHDPTRRVGVWNILKKKVTGR